MDESVKQKNYQWPEQPGRIPDWVYTDKEIFAREIERIFDAANWSYAGLECELPNPGDYKRTFIGNKSILLVRAENGDVNAMLNRCAHRGAELCQHNAGTVKEFMCPYHQWTYDLKGDLCGVPFRRGVKGKGGMPKEFRLEEHGLKKVKVQRRGGAIFACLADNPPPFEEYLGPTVLGYYDRIFNGTGLKLLGYQRQRIPSNWKLILENIKDPYHASLLHVFFVTFGLFRVDQPSRVLIDESGMHTALVSQRGKQEMNDGTEQMRSFNAALKLNDPRLLDVQKEFPGDATVVMHTIWPNLILQQQSNTLATRQIIPLGPNEFEMHWTFFGYETDTEEMTQRRLRQANLMGPGGIVSMDDGEIIARVQDGLLQSPSDVGIVEMGGRGSELETEHMVTEVAIRVFYDGYRKVMGL
jgi:salicylate 5-hydroxylase large subunit